MDVVEPSYIYIVESLPIQFVVSFNNLGGLGFVVFCDAIQGSKGATLTGGITSQNAAHPLTESRVERMFYRRNLM